jgi:hypothetical protein
MSENGIVRKRLDDGRVRFDGPDRRGTVLVTQVETHSGTVYNCVLYVSDEPYGYGEQRTSAIAVTENDIEGVATALLDEV